MYVNGVKVASNGIPYSRILMSWIKVGGECYVHSNFKNWLLSIGLTEEEAKEIYELYSWGWKFELEEHARRYLKEHGNLTRLSILRSKKDSSVT